MFKVRPQDNVVLESCHGCFQMPIRMGEEEMRQLRACVGTNAMINYRRFRELMPPVGLYSESRPDGIHAWSAWDPLGPGSEILR